MKQRISPDLGQVEQKTILTPPIQNQVLAQVNSSLKDDSIRTLNELISQILIPYNIMCMPYQNGHAYHRNNYELIGYQHAHATDHKILLGRRYLSTSQKFLDLVGFKLNLDLPFLYSEMKEIGKIVGKDYNPENINHSLIYDDKGLGDIVIMLDYNPSLINQEDSLDFYNNVLNPIKLFASQYSKKTSKSAQIVYV